MFFRLFKYSIKNILRNKFLSFSSIITLALLMFFVNILMVIHNISNNLIDIINSRLSISLYLDDKYNKDSFEVRRLMEDLYNSSETIYLEFKTKEEVLEQMRQKDPELVSIIQAQNPLPATINISNISLDEYDKINYIIEWKLFILADFRAGSLYDYENQYSRIKAIIAILQTLKFWLYFIIWVFLLSIFVITYSIIWNFIYYYKEEINITKLVWWEDVFIYWPFVFQWIIYSLLSYLLSFNIFLFLLKNIWIIFDRGVVSSFIISSSLWMLFLFQLVIFVLIWAFSSYFGTRKYIK